MSLEAFANWLSQTPASQVVQNVSWIIPSVQSIHIMCISIVMSAVVMVDLRLLGVIGRDQPTAAYTSRFLSWVWPTLALLLLSGSILITGEPGRSLLNPAFQTKMVLLVLAMITTFVLQRPTFKDPAFWELTRGHRMSARVLAVISLVLWVGIVFAGRWIAYMNTAGE